MEKSGGGFFKHREITFNNRPLTYMENDTEMPILALFLFLPIFNYDSQFFNREMTASEKC